MVIKIAKILQFFMLALFVALSPTLLLFESAHAFTGNFAFPILGGGSYSNDFNAPRSNPTGIHHAIDIFAPKHSPLLAAAHGTIIFAPVPQPSYGYIVSIVDDEGYRYNYIHINNDTPGTDDGQGGPMNAYTAYVKSGNRVLRGQHIGYLGDSGNAENTPPHLHFEVQDPDENWVNPYDKLNQAIRFSKPTDPPIQDFETLPYSKSKTGINVALGSTDEGPSPEIVTGPGPGSDRGSRVKLFDNDNTPLLGFDAYPPGMDAGVDVALGDMDGDGQDEIITAPGPGYEPHVKFFNADDPTQVQGLRAYPTDFLYGLHVSAGDIDDDGIDEIIVVPMAGSKPSVKIFKSDGTEVHNFFAFVEEMRSGMDVAVGNMDEDNNEEIIVVPGPNQAPLVRIYEADGVFVREFLAYDRTQRNGVRLSAGDVRLSSSADEIVTVPDVAGVPGVRLYDNTGDILSNQSPIEHWWIGYYDIAAGRDRVIFGTGVNRRASFMEEF